MAHCSACSGVIMNARLIRVRSGLPLVRCNDGDGDGGSANAAADIIDDANASIAIADFLIPASFDANGLYALPAGLPGFCWSLMPALARAFFVSCCDCQKTAILLRNASNARYPATTNHAAIASAVAAST